MLDIATQSVPGVTDPVVRSKLLRLAEDGQSPRVLDLFSGCGGISLGFKREGFEIAANVEYDKAAALSHAINFHRQLDKDAFDAFAEPKDITVIEPDQLALKLGLGTMAEAIDVLVGGPPCQAYARVGRAKLREIADHPEAFQIDPRKDLYLRYLTYVRAFRPLAVLMENVPDMLNQAGHNYADEICEALEGEGYEARYSLINSAFHDVPQMRDRVFIVGVLRELNVRVRFPKATRHMKLPPGYTGTRHVALKHVKHPDLLNGIASRYEKPDLGEGLPFPVKAHEAIDDLPAIRGDSVRRGARRFGPDTFMAYARNTELSDYQVMMREWPGYEGKGGITDHAIRYLPRDGDIFCHLEQGAEYPAAHRLATKLFEQEARRRGLDAGTTDYCELERAMVPPYDPSKFPNRWWKLKEEYPVRTLMAHIGKDTYSHIHYDGDQARTISVREAARLQSFPDGFVFSGTMNPAFRQIGNAVPPLLAAAIASGIREMLKEAVEKQATVRRSRQRRFPCGCR